MAGERRFRLLLYAALPDRVHAEVLSPLGTPLLLVDGGAGRLAVTFVREGEAFVGRATAEALDHVLGVRLDLGDLVRAILTGEGSAPGLLLERSPDDTPGLPERLRLRARSGGSLELDLKGTRPLVADPRALGSGRPPEGVVERPLRELAGAADRLEDLTDEGEP